MITMTEMIKGNYITAIAILALVIVSVFAITRPTTILSTQGNLERRTITVNGVGNVAAAPDESIITLAVTNQATTAAQAANDNSNTMNQVISTITGLSSLSPGITKDDITTTDYSLTPVYTQTDQCGTATTNPIQPPLVTTTCTTTTPQLVGYAVRNAIQITVKDMTSIGRVLDVATGSGANEIDGITFTFTPNTYANLQKQALQKALQDASGQAQATASGLGVHIAGVISVNPAYVYQPYINNRISTAAGPTSTPIQTGTLQVTVNVQVVYEITP